MCFLGVLTAAPPPGKTQVLLRGTQQGQSTKAIFLAEIRAISPLPIFSLVQQAKGEITHSALLNVGGVVDLAHLLWVFKKSNLPMHTRTEGSQHRQPWHVLSSPAASSEEFPK